MVRAHLEVLGFSLFWIRFCFLMYYRILGSNFQHEVSQVSFVVLSSLGPIGFFDGLSRRLDVSRVL